MHKKEGIKIQTSVQPLPIGHNVSRIGFAIAYGAFYFAGGSAITLWSAMTLSLDFFTKRYPDNHVAFLFPVVNMSVSLIVNFYMVLAGRRQAGLHFRMHTSLFSYFIGVLLLALTNNPPIATYLSQKVAYGLTVIVLAATTVASTVVAVSMYGLAGVVGPIFLQALEGGKAFGAILLFIARLILLWKFQGQDEDGERPVIFFFVTAGTFVAISWILFTAMHYSKFGESLFEEYEQNTHHVSPPSMFSQLASPPPSPVHLQSSRIPGAFSTTDGNETEISRLLGKNNFGDPDPNGTQANGNIEDADGSSNYSSCSVETYEDTSDLEATGNIRWVLHRAGKPCFSLFFTFFVCLSCFPGLLSIIPSTNLALSSWYPILLVGCYNVGDLVGKNLTVYYLYFTVSTLHQPWGVQLAFIPIFIIAVVHPFSDYLVMLLVLAFGCISGYIGTTSMILAPTMVPEQHKEVAGMIATLCVMLGLFVGSYNGFLLDVAIQIYEGGSNNS